MATAKGKGRGRNLQAAWCEAVTADDRLTGTDVAVAWRLASYANADGTNAHPSNVRLGRECRLKVSEDKNHPEKGGRCHAVERALKRLLTLGYLGRDKHERNQRVWVYRLMLPEGQTPRSSERGKARDAANGAASTPVDSQEAPTDRPRAPASANPALQRAVTSPVTNPADSAPAERAASAAEPTEQTQPSAAWKAARAALKAHRTLPPTAVDD